MSILSNLLAGLAPDGSAMIAPKSRGQVFAEARACVVRDWPNQAEVARMYRAIDEVWDRNEEEPTVFGLLRKAEFLAFPS